MTNVSHKNPSPTEQAGLALVRTAVEGEAVFTDTGDLPNRHDWEIHHNGNLVAAIEITSAQDRQRRSLKAALKKHWHWDQEVLRQPTLTKRWIVNPSDVCNFPKVRERLVTLLEELEANDITELREADQYRHREHLEPEYADYFRYMLEQAERLHTLGFQDVEAAPSQAETGGEVIVVIARVGVVASDASHLVDLAETTVADPNDHDLQKLANSGAPEGHLVVFIGDGDTFAFKGKTITAFGALRALRTRQLPTASIALPPRISGLWFAPLHADYPAAAYLRNDGWRFIETTTIWKNSNQTDQSAITATS